MLEIKFIERTLLNVEAYSRLIGHYGKSLKYPIYIVFDARIKDYADYQWDDELERHVIRISPNRCVFTLKSNNKRKKLDPEAQLHHFVSSTLHELYHAIQCETHPEYGNEGYDSIESIEDHNISSWYSPCEVDARIFENTNIHEAVQLYRKFIQK